jgi:hypothetical protein
MSDLLLESVLICPSSQPVPAPYRLNQTPSYLLERRNAARSRFKSKIRMNLLQWELRSNGADYYWVEAVTEKWKYQVQLDLSFDDRWVTHREFADIWTEWHAARRTLGRHVQIIRRSP